MSKRTFKAGNNLNGEITINDYDGLYIPGSLLRDPHVQFQEFKFRDDDVVICSYPKSGYHWIWELTSMLLKNSKETTKDVPGSFLIDTVPRERLEQLPSPRVLGTHSHFEIFPESVKQTTCKFINVVRDPRSVAVSGYHFFSNLKTVKWSGDWSGYLDLAIKGEIPWNDWFSHAKSWEKMRRSKAHKNPVHLVYYEDLLRDPFCEVKRLAEFLQTDTLESLIYDIVEATNFTKLKAEKTDIIKADIISSYFGNNDPCFYRKGKVDDWKMLFTVDQHELFVRYFQEKMKGFNIKLKSTTSPVCEETGCNGSAPK